MSRRDIKFIHRREHGHHRERLHVSTTFCHLLFCSCSLETRLSRHTERVLYCQPTGPYPLNHRDDFSRPALRHGSLNFFYSKRTQVGFFDFIVRPLVVAWTACFPESRNPRTPDPPPSIHITEPQTLNPKPSTMNLNPSTISPKS